MKTITMNEKQINSTIKCIEDYVNMYRIPSISKQFNGIRKDIEICNANIIIYTESYKSVIKRDNIIDDIINNNGNNTRPIIYTLKNNMKVRKFLFHYELFKEDNGIVDDICSDTLDKMPKDIKEQIDEMDNTLRVYL